MKERLTLYDKEFLLESFEVVFIESFKETHSLHKSLKLLTDKQAVRVNGSLRNGKSQLALAFKKFIESDPIHPEANKVVLVDNLVWIMNQAKADLDTQGVLRAISELNKMIKGNLANSKDVQVIEKHLIGVIDLSKPEETKEPVTIDVT